MVENLKVTHYNDGSEISYPSGEDFGSLDEGQYAVYDNDPANADIYGNLYNWAVVDDDRGVCPAGWHVPSVEEFSTLILYHDEEATMNGWGFPNSDIAGGTMKSTGTIEDGDGLWYAPNGGATNERGFTAFPAGICQWDSCNSIGEIGSFWSSSEYSSNAWYLFLYYNHSSAFLGPWGFKTLGYSIRCLQDDIEGCTDPEACNYDESANVDDGSCIYPEESYDCAGNCIAVEDCAGVCGGDSWIDQCGDCDDDPLNDCVQDCAGEWGGTSVIDECGVCGGDGFSCAVYIEASVTTTVDASVFENNEVFEDNFEALVETQLGLPEGSVVITNITVLSREDLEIMVEFTITLTEEELAETDFGSSDDVSDAWIEVEAEITNDGLEFLDGCTDSAFCNFNADATIDDGSCLTLDCAGECGGTAIFDCEGICDGTALVDMCGICDSDTTNDCIQDCAGIWGGDALVDMCDVCNGDNSSCSGCTDPYATNYNPEAIVPDDSCIYPNYFETIWDEMNTTIMAIYIESAELDGTALDHGDEICIFDGDACVGVARLDSPIDETYQVFVPADNSSTPEIDGYIAGNPIAFLYWDVSSQTVYSDIDITIISGSSTYQDFANTTVELSYDHIYGCTGESSCNYNPDANVDDGSCIYPDDHHDCYGNCLVEPDCAGNCCVLGEEGCYWQETGSCGEDEPSNGMDSCGVCGGDNSSCLDCAGVPCSDAYMDNCGVCDDIPENDCVQDCNGDWGGTATIDECGVCGGDGAIYECGCEDIADGECDCGVLQELGDMNCDYLLNVLDIVALVQEVLNDNEYYVYADVNEDGFVNILDVVILVNWVLNGEPSICDGLTEVELWGDWYDIGNTTSIDLYNQELTGSIPPEIGCLTNLTDLDLGYNQLTGEIPSEIGNLTNLTVLALDNNQLTGEIPPEIGNLTVLEGLYLFGNQLTGEIPQEVCDLIESNNWETWWNIEDYILAGNNLINTCD